MRQSVRLPVVASAVLIVCGGPASSRVLDQARVGTWQVATVTDDATGGARESAECQARTDGRDGVGLLLTHGSGAGWSVGFLGDLGARPGQSYPVRLRIDDGPVRIGTATVETRDRVRIPLDEPAGFLGEFSRGRRLDADAGAERLSFILRGTRAVVAEVTACGRRLASRIEVAGTAALGPAPPVRTDRAAVPDGAERRLEALTVQANVLSRAKVAGFELQPSTVPGRLQGHDVTWRAGDVAGSLRVLGPDAAASADGIRADLVSADIRSCSDRFTAEAGPAPDGRGATLFTSCGGEKGWAADYLAVPRPGQGVYVFMVTGAPDKAEALRTTATALRGAAVEIAGRTATP